MLRQRFLRGTAASAAAGLALVRAQAAAPAASLASPTHRIRVGYLGNVCEAVSYGAPSSSDFHREKLGAQLVRFDTERALAAALSAGSVDAASMRLPALLHPLESGANVRVIAGLHAGCLRVVAPESQDVTRIADLRGKTIATDELNGSSMSLLSALLAVQGIDARHEVTWKVYDPGATADALAAKNVQCVAAADPLGYFLIKTNSAVPYLDTSDGGFTCGSDFAHGHHCFLAVHGGIVDKQPALAASIARAYVASSNAMPKRAGAEAVIDARGGYADRDVAQTIGMLTSYLWNATTDFVVEELELTARDFQGAGILRASTDPHDLANRAYANVLNV